MSNEVAKSLYLMSYLSIIVCHELFLIIKLLTSDPEIR